MNLVAARGREETDHAITGLASAHILEDSGTRTAVSKHEGIRKCIAASAKAGWSRSAKSQRVHDQDARGHLRLPRVGVGPEQLQHSAAALSQVAAAADAAADGGKVRRRVRVVVDDDFPVAAGDRRQIGNRGSSGGGDIEGELSGADDAGDGGSRRDVRTAARECLADRKPGSRAAGKGDGGIASGRVDIDGSGRTRGDREGALDIHLGERGRRAEDHAIDDKIRRGVPSRGAAGEIDGELRGGCGEGCGETAIDPVQIARDAQNAA